MPAQDEKQPPAIVLRWVGLKKLDVQFDNERKELHRENVTSQPKIRYAAGQRLRVLVKGQWCWSRVLGIPPGASASEHELEVELPPVEEERKDKTRKGKGKGKGEKGRNEKQKEQEQQAPRKAQSLLALSTPAAVKAVVHVRPLQGQLRAAQAA